MTRIHLIAVLLVAGALTWIAEAYLGTTSYRLNGINYAVPHAYEFTRQFRVPWLAGVKGLAREPDESLWLLLPARELARDVPGYKRAFHGYTDQVEADVVVNVVGGKEALKFRGDRIRLLRNVDQAKRDGAELRLDPTTGWTRVVWIGGEKGTPGEGHSNFYLMPKEGAKQLPADQLPPSCLGSPDMNGSETYSCSFTIHRNDFTFDFTLREENLAVADRVPAYVMRRLEEWR